MKKTNFREHFKLYLTSLKLKSNFLYSFIVDGLYWLVMVVIFNLVYKYLNFRADTFGGGRTADQLKEYLVTSTPEQAQAVLAEMQSYLLTLVVFSILFIILAVLLFSLSRALIWHFLLKKKFSFKKHFKWNWLTLLVILFCIPLAIILSIIRLIINYLILDLDINLVVYGIFQLILLLAFVYLVFLFFYHFTKTYRVWSSIGSVFETIAGKFKKVAFSYVFVFLTMAVISLIFMFLTPSLPYSNIVFPVVYLLALAWFRTYLIRVIE